MGGTCPSERIRNVALIGHGGSGKTTLAEALLLRSGAVTRAGKVDEGSSLLDTEPEEQRRKISLSLALAPFEWIVDGITHKVNVIDTPGYADFTSEVDAALSVCDLAVLVVSAVEGVEVQSEMLWRRAAALGVPRMIFINKEDKERADFHRVLDELRAAFGPHVLAVELPVDERDGMHAVADVLTEHVYEYDADGRHHEVAMPAAVAVEERAMHDALVEEIVSGDDEQLERYLSGDVPTAAELERTLAHEVLGLQAFPVLVGSASTGVGVDRLADLICELGPSPADRPMEVDAGDTTVAIAADASRPALAYVFKTVADPFVGQLSLFKVLSGTLRSDDHLVNSRSGADERLHGLLTLRGKEQTPTTTVGAGDLAAVAKLSSTATGDTLAPKGSPVRVRSTGAPASTYAVAIAPRTQADDDKLGAALARLRAEDPALSVERNDETHQTLLGGAGETHIAVTLERLARKFGVNVEIEDIRLPYRETVVGTAESEGKVKKQTGGHGQYAVANLRVRPLSRGEGFTFTTSIVGGAIPGTYLPAVRKGIEESMSSAGVHGFPVVDVAVECYDGKFHSVDSSEMAFKTAAAQGFKDAVAAAGVVVLEPVSRLTVVVPASSQGDVLGDLNARRGRVVSTSVTDDGDQQVVALVPSAEILRYAADLRSLASGRGWFTAEHSHYDVLPQHLIPKVTAKKPTA